MAALDENKQYMPWTDSEINARLPVWNVLSEFWLDGYLVESDYARMAKKLKASPYSKEELFKICIYEVAPAVSRNLLSIAGEWGAFDPEWLKSRIIKKSPDPESYLNPGIWRKLKGLLYASHVNSYGWKAIVKKL